MPDAIGNLYKTEDCTDRTYGASGQLLTEKTPDGINSYEYDPEGNLIQKTESTGRVWEYHWNAAGFMTKVIRPNGEEVAFTYDALGRRVTKTYKGNKNCFVWDGNVILHEWVEEDFPLPASVIKMPREDMIEDEVHRRLLEQMVAHTPSHGPPEENSEITTWVYEPESFIPIAKLIGERSYSILSDHLGTPIEMLDERGKSVWSADYISSSGVLSNLEGEKTFCPFRWQGQYVDVETNLHYNRFRYYDPAIGQYISQDPIGLAGGNPTLYGYVSDANVFVDPLGLEPQKIVIIGEGQKAVDEAARLLDADSGNYRVESMMWPNNQWRGGALYEGMPAADFQKAFDWNAKWLEGKIADGYKVVDIGMDKREIRSPFYEAELKVIKDTDTPLMRLKKFKNGESIEDMRKRTGTCGEVK